MTDLDRRMKELDWTAVPDLWPDIETRVPTVRVPDGGSRLAAAVVAALVAAAGIGVVTWTLLPDRSAPPTSPSPAAPMIRNGEIWFTSGGKGGFYVYEIQPDGTGERQLFRDARAPEGPLLPEAIGSGYEWSPDGSRVAFARHTDFDPEHDGSRYEIFLMDPDGTNIAQLTFDQGVSSEPSWSPDGTRIAYARASEGEFMAGCWGSYICPSDIFVIDADGSDPVQITDHAADDSELDWSPDGTKIVFASARSDPEGIRHHIYVMNADGSDVTRLAEEPQRVSGPTSWSPDGTKIAFFGFSEAVDVYVMNADGSGLTNLTNFGGKENTYAQDLTWSPDGARIAFTTDLEGPGALFVIDADGSNLTRLTHVQSGAGDIAWRPVEA